MSENPTEEKSGVIQNMKDEQRLFFIKRKVFARMNKIVGGVPVQQGKLRKLDLTKQTFTWKNGKYAIVIDGYKVEKIRWPKRQRIVIDFDIDKALPMSYKPREFNKDAIWFANVLKSEMTKSVLKSDQTMKMIALIAMVCAMIGFAAAMFAWTNPEQVQQITHGKPAGQPSATPPKTVNPSSFHPSIMAQEAA